MHWTHMTFWHEGLNTCFKASQFAYPPSFMGINPTGHHVLVLVNLIYKKDNLICLAADISVPSEARC